MKPQDMDKMASQVEALFYDLQNRTMADIVRRLQKMDKITATADLQINRLLDLGNTSEYIESELLRVTGYSNAKIWELYDKVVEDQYTANRAVYEQVNDKFVPFPENEQLQSWYHAAVSRNQDEILNITKSLGFYVSMNGARKVFTPLSEVYSSYLNHAAMDVLTGAQSYNTVLRRVAQELSTSGMQWIDYATGYHCRATTAARRAVLTGVNQMSAQINEQTAKDLGTDTFEVTWHSGARPTHGWGGNIYTKKQLHSVCGLGNVDGLCGANCRHAYHAFIPGISVRSYSPEELERLNAKEREMHIWNGKQYNAYEATARQREMERSMRAQRSKIVSLKQGGADAEDIMNAQSRYLGTLDGYKRFSKEMGLQPDMERVYADRLGRVVNGKINLVTSVKSSIMKSGNEEPGGSKSRAIKKKRIIEKCVKSNRAVFSEDEFGVLAQDIKKKAGFYDVAMHGTPKTINAFGTRIDAKMLSEILRRSDDYNGEPVRLLSCNTGKGENCFAQRLSNELNVVVEAPNDIIWARSDRTYTIGPNSHSNTGEMIIFNPEGK